MTADIRQHPLYHEGFYAAADSEPLFDDHAAEFKAGWLAYWECRAALLQIAGESA